MTRPPRPFESLKRKWEQVESSNYQSLLRLAITRDLARQVHAGISGSMADSRAAKVEAGSLRDLNTRLDSLRGHRTFNFAFNTLMEDFSALPEETSPRKLSARLLAAFGRERLERYDRSWELAIAVDAERAGWAFWHADSAMPLQAVSAWNQGLGDRLFPRGIVLFCEKSPEPATDDSLLWGGRWSVVTDPEIAHPSKLVSDTRWTLL